MYICACININFYNKTIQIILSVIDYFYAHRFRNYNTNIQILKQQLNESIPISKKMKKV